ncbi:ribosome small subunit-dependent GTPase A [Pseudarthrobacter sp. J75]|uniref:ribosome small subunit-dependent GTPase A n=1 Tax=unclassified Pseudarthrobacter TaxID=2647000 RepID=UPI002E80E890|nr:MULTISPECIES: ribosome small subunit-dependent GTPase A [unclassified Pseudarthrobacter]MEE2521425.1 ribosome small subunit-dependent GTPase A [Pseudarthrobacter sp. J47]MEE2528657.1 ribosome small subunit-dependent GTPase A [Pseudarthrobacter sp. J75]MEE2568349.1 ribosome small subunit-dependent GTPase A [Pseudarthrobacter sp. J64]
MPRRTDSWDESDVRIRPSKKGSRPRTKDRPSHDDAVTGRIITVDRGRYTAVVDEASPDERVVIAARARELRRSPVVAGDFVSLVGDVSGAPDTLARLVRIQDRNTLLRRSADDTDPIERAVVANADQLVVVVAAANPEPRTGFIDRALVAAYDAGIEPLLLVTKADVKDPAELLSNYEHLDFPVIISRTADSGVSGIDARSDDGLSAKLDKQAVAELRAHLDGKVTVMLGHSGVGKSTMVNALTGAERATGGVNAVTGRGRHTSSSALALKLTDSPAGSWIIDTPGIRSFGLAHVDPDRILRAFPDLEPGTEGCGRGCKHKDTPDCGLDAYVAAGSAGPSGPARLASLRRLLGVDPRLEGQESKELGSIS